MIRWVAFPLLVAFLALQGCIPAEVYAWNKSHALPCNMDSCGKEPR